MKLYRLIFRCCLLSIILFLACSKNGSDYPDFEGNLSFEKNADAFIETYVQDNSPGISILVRKGNEILLNKSYGYSNLETQSPIHSDTPFYLASVSKQFTAMTIMILAERGLISYEASLKEYLTETPDSWSDITIHHLLTHRSGIPDYLSDLDWYAPGLTNEKVLQDLIVYEQLEFEPGEKYEYSNSGYSLLASITARVSGKPFQEFLKDEIFNPLEMNQSLGFDESRPLSPGRAVGYFNDGQLNDYELLTMGDGGMFSTINDLDKWERSFTTNALVSATTKERAFTSHHSNGYGYGWGIDNVYDTERISHGGGLNGYRTHISRYPEKDFTVIMLSNGSFEWLGALLSEIEENYL